MLCSSSAWTQARAWFRDYDNVQRVAVFLLYIQIACALIGSIGAFYTGELLVNLVVALFALVAIESGSQILGRTYALLLCCTLLLDITWFILFFNEIRYISSKKYGKYLIFSVRVTLWMQIIGFSLRFVSSLLWFQMYRLGVPSDSASHIQSFDVESRTNLLTPVSRSPAPSRQTSISNEILGGSIYNPAYYSTLFQGRKDHRQVYEMRYTADLDFTLALLFKKAEAPFAKIHGHCIWSCCLWIVL
eukprot:Gb_00755 [translate_table: standard]